MKTKCFLIGFCFCALSTFGEVSSGVELPKNAPVPVLVENVRPKEDDLGLTREFILSKVELELRRNGITPEDGSVSDRGYFIYINVSVTGDAYAWEVSFGRQIEYDVKGKKYRRLSHTYSKEGYGTYGVESEARNVIMNEVISAVDILSNKILESAK